MKSAFVVAAPHSGSGKTTVTLSLIAALTARGLRVQSFKAGPDYIDAAHHARLTGRPSHNLDTWMLSEEANRSLFSRATPDCDVAVVEGVMGLFDGVDGRRPEGSTAHLARQLGLPVLLVVDARSMARSAAALVSGFLNFEPGLRMAGVIWNRVGSPAHRRILDEALAASGLPPAWGGYGRHAEISLGERHLGLVTPEDVPLSKESVARLAELAETSLDLDGLLAATRLEAPPPAPAISATPPPRRLRVGVARDRAFSFYYEENLRLLCEAGGEPVFFSPVEGDGLPPGIDALYLGGGYPELHAERLSRNSAFLDSLRDHHRAGKPLYAECGGFMTLCREVDDPEGRRFPMAGIFPASALMGGRAFRLGYREVEGVPGTVVAGMRARGHEFHYSRIDEMPETVERIYRVRNARGEDLTPEGYRTGSAVGGYIHLHFASNPGFALKLLGLA